MSEQCHTERWSWPKMLKHRVIVYQEYHEDDCKKDQVSLINHVTVDIEDLSFISFIFKNKEDIMK